MTRIKIAQLSNRALALHQEGVYLLSMLPEVQSLLIIQDRDQKIHAIQQDLVKMPREKAKAEAQLDADKKAVSDAKTAAQENEIAMKSIELDIATRRNSIEKLQVQQFETKKNEEFTAIGNDILRVTAAIDELETSELELLEQQDELTEKHASAVKRFTENQTFVAGLLSDIEKKTAAANARLDELQPERALLVQKIDDSMLALYERLLKSKGIDPVVPLKGTQCGGCHMKVTQTTVINVQAEAAPAQCDNCGRFLYSV